MKPLGDETDIVLVNAISVEATCAMKGRAGI